MSVITRGGSSNSLYLSIYDGSMVLRSLDRDKLVKMVELVDGHPDDIKERKIAKGKYEGDSQYYYEVFGINGVLKKAEIKDNDWGQSLQLEFDDVGQTLFVELGDPVGKFATDLVRRLDNVDLSREMTFSAWSMDNVSKTNGKTYTNSGVTITQGGNKAEYAIERDAMPAPKEVKRRGKVEWDWSEREDFVYDLIDKFVKKVNSTDVSTPKKPSKAKVEERDDDIEDDLPF